MLPSKRLLVAPYGVGHGVPFAAVPLAGRPLGCDRTIVQLPSAGVLPLLGSGRVDPGGPLLAVGNPLGDLGNAGLEARWAARLFGAKPLVGKEATEAAVRSVVPDCRILWLATHGDLNEENPLASSLTLAHGEELSLFELMGLRLHAELVVLSACESGRGKTTGGDDVVGLARGVLAAGGQAAVVSFWIVDDAATSLLLARFAELLRSGKAAAEALGQAQSWLRRLCPSSQAEAMARLSRGAAHRESLGEIDADNASGNERVYDHPYYWAPFICVSR